MGILLDSSVVIRAERRHANASQLLEGILNEASDQEVGISAIGLTELVHGIYRADTSERSAKRQEFVRELRQGLNVYPYTAATAFLAGRIHGEQMARGVVIPTVDLMIGATALELGYRLMTTNLRHFRMIPGLHVVSA